MNNGENYLSLKSKLTTIFENVDTFQKELIKLPIEAMPGQSTTPLDIAVLPSVIL